MQTKIYIYLIALVVGVLALSCKEEEIVEKIINIPGDTVQVTAEVNYTDILAFTVPGGEEGTVLKASVREDSIYLYWPVYWALPEYIVPEIAVAEKASISPASGEEVPLKTGEAYYVTAEDGTEKAYFLNLVVNQPQPWFENNANIDYQGNSRAGVLRGDFIIPDTALTHLFLISTKSQQETELEIVAISETNIYVYIPEDMDTTSYQMKLVSGWRTAYEINDRNFYVGFSPPRVNWTSAKTVAKGEMFTIEGSNLKYLESATFQVMAGTEWNSPWMNLEIVEYTSTSVTIKIPEDFPYAGQCGNMQIYHPNMGVFNHAYFINVGPTSRLTIVE